MHSRHYPPFWKQKGDKLVCSNHRAITLLSLSILGKLYTRILISRAFPAFPSDANPNKRVSCQTTLLPITFQPFVSLLRNHVSSEKTTTYTLLSSISRLPLIQSTMHPFGKPSNSLVHLPRSPPCFISFTTMLINYLVLSSHCRPAVCK